MPNPDHYRKLEAMYNSAPINAYFKPTAHIQHGQAEILLSMRPDFHHAANATHGAVYFKVLDDCTFFAANSVLDDVSVVTVSFNLYLLRPIATGTMRGVGKIVSQTARLIIAEGEVFNDQGKLIARGSGSFMPSSTPLSPDIGYRLPPDPHT